MTSEEDGGVKRKLQINNDGSLKDGGSTKINQRHRIALATASRVFVYDDEEDSEDTDPYYHDRTTFELDEYDAVS